MIACLVNPVLAERLFKEHIWVVVNGRLWRCAPQQLRRASEREVAEELLAQRRPWTCENIVKDIHIGEYHDNIGAPGEDLPPEDAQQDEQRPAEEAGAPEDMDQSGDNCSL